MSSYPFFALRLGMGDWLTEIGRKSIARSNHRVLPERNFC